MKAGVRAQGNSILQKFALELVKGSKLIGGAAEHAEPILVPYRANRRNKTFRNGTEMDQQSFEDGILKSFEPLFAE